MKPKDTPLQEILRRALARAGLVNGYDHGCRRCKARGTPHVEHHTDAATRHCPICGMKLWPKPVHRPIRFHDLRGTTATLLARAGVPLVVAQRILRHSDPRLTSNVYSHVDLADLRAGLNRIGIPAMPMLANAGSPPRLVPLVSPRASLGKNTERDASQKSSEVRALRQSGRQDLNLRPLGPEGARSLVYGLASHVTDSHPLDTARADPPALPDGLAPPGTATIPRGEPLVNGPVVLERFLTASDVADRLRVCRATVYALCERGELPHLRVSGAVRIVPEDLAKFVARTRRLSLD